MAYIQDNILEEKESKGFNFCHYKMKLLLIANTRSQFLHYFNKLHYNCNIGNGKRYLGLLCLCFENRGGVGGRCVCGLFQVITLKSSIICLGSKPKP